MGRFRAGMLAAAQRRADNLIASSSVIIEPLAPGAEPWRQWPGAGGLGSFCWACRPGGPATHLVTWWHPDIPGAPVMAALACAEHTRTQPQLTVT